MDLAAIRARFDEERRRLAPADVERQECGSVVRHVSRFSTSSTIVFSEHEPAALGAAIERETAFFDRLGHELEWKAYDHDRPADLVERLREAGFEIGPPEAVVVAEVAQVLARLPAPAFRVERLTDADRLQDYDAVSAGVWSSSGSVRVAETMRRAPDEIGVYVAYAEGAPVGCGRSSFHPDSWFSGLWGGGVLPAHRRRGVYLSLVARRARDAEASGARYLQADALPTSRPILEGLGFEAIAVTRPCEWRRSGGAG